MKIEIPAYINSVIKRYYSAGFEAFCVGGAVRDSILKTTPEDWDITTNALPGTDSSHQMLCLQAE